MYVEKFDYEDYFSDRRGSLLNEYMAPVGTSAVGIITPKQSITRLTLPWYGTFKRMTPGLGGHAQTAEALIKEMFPNEDIDYKEILEKCIYIMYSSRINYSLCAIYLSENISNSQLLALQEISNSIFEVYKKKFWNLEVDSSYYKVDGTEDTIKDVNNFENIMKEAKKVVLENYELPWEEKIIANEEKSLKRSR